MFFDKEVLYFSIAYVKNATKSAILLAFKIIYSNYENLGSTEKNYNFTSPAKSPLIFWCSTQKQFNLDLTYPAH